MGRTRESANLVSDKNIFVDIANDLVGIGTTAPTATLEVSGTLAVSGVSTFQTHVHLGDSDELRFGAGDDLKIYHDGTSNIFLGNGTADFKIQDANHSSAIFDTSAAVQLYYDNSEKFRTKSDGIDVTGEVQCDSLDVDGVANISSVLTMQSYIQGTGTLNLYGSSSSSNPLALDTDGNVTLQGDLDLQDDDKILLGTGDDIQIWHSGTYSNIKNDTGQLRVRSDDLRLQNNAADENYITCTANGAVSVYYDNSNKLSTKSDGIDVTGEVQCDSLDVDGTADITGTVTLHGNLDLQDSDEIRIGTGDDLKIYHDGSNSYIIEDGTGNLIIDSNQLSLRNADTDNVLLDTTSAGAVRVRYNGTTKLETSGGGVTVTGVATATSFSGDGSNLTNVPTGFSPINFVLS
mgnify:CR=1 FL=1